MASTTRYRSERVNTEQPLEISPEKFNHAIPTANSNDVYIATTPGAPGQTVTIGFWAQGVHIGRWTNYAELTSPAFFGTYIDPFSGEVVRP